MLPTANHIRKIGYHRTRHSDPAYAGYEQAINNSPLLKNPESHHKITQLSGLSMANAMRHIGTKAGEIKISRAEELRRKQEARLAELAELN